jgi:hypothetical protein
MDDRLLKLLSVASEPLLTPPHPREAERLSSIGAKSAELWEILLWKNGWYAFESALHLFPLGTRENILDLQDWNSESLWRSEYKELASDCFFFAEDTFGSQFCFKEGQIHTFDPETGRTRIFASHLGEWAGKILDDYNLYTGYPVAHEWQRLHRPLTQGERLLPKTPFVFQGAYTVENLYALDCVEGMKLRASIAIQLRDLPDGSRVRLRVTGKT